jgi:hypothetical protein
MMLTPEVGRAFKDATAVSSKERMHAAHELNGPDFAHAILTTAELVALLPHE